MTRLRSRLPRQRAVDRKAVHPAPRINHDESPLAWLASRKDKDGQPLLTAAQFQAGEQLRRDFTFAMLSPRVTASWSAAPSDPASRRSSPGCGLELADNVIAARERVNRAITAMGPELSGILLDVCCYLKGLEAMEKAAGWPQRSGKIVLTIALQKLARHYGLLRDHLGGSQGRVRHWGADGYRPSIDPDLNAESA